MSLYQNLWLAVILRISHAQLPSGSYRAPNYHSGYNGYQASGRLSTGGGYNRPRSYRAPNYHSGYNGYQASSRLSSWNYESGMDYDSGIDYDSGFPEYEASPRLSPSAGNMRWFFISETL